MEILDNKTYYKGNLIGSWTQHHDNTVTVHLHGEGAGKAVTVKILDRGSPPNEDMDTFVTSQYFTHSYMLKLPKGTQEKTGGFVINSIDIQDNEN